MRRITLFLFLAVLTVPAQARPAQPVHWVASWATSEQIPELRNALPAEALTDSTLRQAVRLSLGGNVLRLKLSNEFGTAPLHLLAVHIAMSLPGGAVDPASDRALSFGDRADVVIPAGASYLSDPVAFAVPPFSDLAITVRYGEAPAQQTSHPGSRTTSYYLPGDHLSDAALPEAKTIDHWFQIASIEVMAPPRASAVVVVGDSITDGRGSTTNGNDRWTDALAHALAARRAGIAVLNAGLGGNRLLNDGLGPNTLARFDRDVLAPPGVKALIVFEGINDLGTLTADHPVPVEEHDALVRRMIAAYGQIAERAHAHGIKAYIATITPFMGTEVYHPDAANEADRNAVNAWIRTQRVFDGVIDFDKLVRDPARPDHLLPAYDTGDKLHLSPAGYRVMGEAAAAFLHPAKPHARHRRKGAQRH
jgi:lysophospholipase L1-like esterase